MKKKIILLTALLSLAGGGLLTAAQAGAKKSQTPDAMRELAQLQGTWRGPVTLQSGGQTIEGKATLKCRSASDGFAVLCDSSFALGGGVQKETDLFGYDPATGQYHWFAVNSGGDTHDHVATHLDGGRSEWRYEGKADGKTMVETIAMTIADGGRQARFESTVEVAGQRAAVLRGEIEKVGKR